MKAKLKKLDRLLIKIQDNICAVIFFIIFVLCLLQILFRSVIYVSSPWTEEFARVGLIYLTFFGAAVGIRMQAHPSADFLTKMMSLRARMVVSIIGELLMITMTLVFVIYGYQYCLWTVNDHSTTYYYSKSIWYYCIPISGAIMTLYCVRGIVYEAMSIVKNRDMLKEANSDE